MQAAVKQNMRKITFSSNKIKYHLKKRTENMCNCGKDAAARRLLCKRVTHCIFDIDGTLLNSVGIIENMVKDICEKYDKPCTDELLLPLYGASKRQFCEIIIKNLNLDVTQSELEDQVKEMAVARIPQAPLQIGANRLISHLYEHKIPMALATNANKYELSQVIQAKPDFFNKFHHMVAVEDVNDRGKPEPDLYLTAAARFSKPANPSLCLAFEDTTTGLRAALAAKMQVVLTPHDNVIDEQYVNELTQILPDLLQFKPEYYGLPPFSPFSP